MFSRKRWGLWGLAACLALYIMGISVGDLVTPPAQAIHQNQSDITTTADTSFYHDPTGRFKIAILPGYQLTPLGNIFVAESSNRQIAYTVTVRPTTTDNLNDAALGQMAVESLGRGEGFLAGTAVKKNSGVVVPWQGTLGAQHIRGKLYARQMDQLVLILALSTTPANNFRLDELLTTLAPSLQPI